MLDRMTESNRTRTQVITEFVAQSAFPRHLGLRLDRIEPDHAEVVMPFDPALATLGDTVHGGAIASLIDTAGMVGAWADDVVPERLAGATVNLSVEYVAAAHGVDLAARAAVLRRGRSLCFVEVDVVDPAGSLVAKGMLTYRFG